MEIIYTSELKTSQELLPGKSSNFSVPVQNTFKVVVIKKEPVTLPEQQGDDPRYFKFDASTGTIQGLTSAGEAYYKNNGGKW